MLVGVTSYQLQIFDGLEGVSVGGFTDDYFERILVEKGWNFGDLTDQDEWDMDWYNMTLNTNDWLTHQGLFLDLYGFFQFNLGWWDRRWLWMMWSLIQSINPNWIVAVQ